MNIRPPLLALAFFLLASSLATPSARAEDKPAASAPVPGPKLEFVYLEVTGVDAAEVPAIVAGLGRLDGVRSVAWTVSAQELKVVREAGKAVHSALVKAATEAGAGTAAVVPVAVTTLTFEKVLHCGGCVRKVSDAVLGVKGTKEAAVAEGLDRVTVVYDTRTVQPKAVADALAKAGIPCQAPAP